MNKRQWIVFLASWLVAMLILGYGGGVLAVRLSAPFYFGFFFGFTLTGLTALFALAARLGNARTSRLKD